MEAEIIQLLANNGVLGGVLVWFMLRMEKHVQNNTAMMESVRETMRTCQKKV